MALTATVEHSFTSGIPDDPAALAAGEVTPSRWNGTAAHTVVLSGTASDAQLPDVITAGGPTGGATSVPVITFDAKGRLTAVTTATVTYPGSFSGFANPTASVGLTAVNGSAPTAMRSDAAPPIDQAVAPTWTGLHQWALGTITTSQPYTFTQTWNAGAVTFTALDVNITNTASAAASKLIDLRLGGVSQFSVTRSGAASALASMTVGTTNDGYSNIPTGSALRKGGANKIAMSVFNTDRLLGFANDGYIAWFNNASIDSGTADLFYSRGGAATHQLGAANAASPVAQTVQAQGSRAGTDSNVGGANLTVQPGTGTGTGTEAAIVFKSPVKAASGSGAQTQTTSLTIQSGVPIMPTYAFAGLPATPVVGMMAYVSDSNTATWGATIAGGGANKVLAWYNNANWTVIGA